MSQTLKHSVPTSPVNSVVTFRCRKCGRVFQHKCALVAHEKFCQHKAKKVMKVSEIVLAACRQGVTPLVNLTPIKAVAERGGNMKVLAKVHPVQRESSRTLELKSRPFQKQDIKAVQKLACRLPKDNSTVQNPVEKSPTSLGKVNIKVEATKILSKKSAEEPVVDGKTNVSAEKQKGIETLHSTGRNAGKTAKSELPQRGGISADNSPSRPAMLHRYGMDDRPQMLMNKTAKQSVYPNSVVDVPSMKLLPNLKQPLTLTPKVKEDQPEKKIGIQIRKDYIQKPDNTPIRAEPVNEHTRIRHQIEQDNKTSEDSVKDKGNNESQSSKEMEEKMLSMIQLNLLKCLPCQRKFQTVNNLKRHVAGHLGWFRYKCSECDFKCYTRCDCVVHIMKIHLKMKNREKADQFVNIIETGKSCDKQRRNADNEAVDGSENKVQASRRLKEDQEKENTEVGKGNHEMSEDGEMRKDTDSCVSFDNEPRGYVTRSLSKEEEETGNGVSKGCEGSAEPSGAAEKLQDDKETVEKRETSDIKEDTQTETALEKTEESSVREKVETQSDFEMKPEKKASEAEDLMDDPTESFEMFQHEPSAPETGKETISDDKCKLLENGEIERKGDGDTDKTECKEQKSETEVNNCAAEEVTIDHNYFKVLNSRLDQQRRLDDNEYLVGDSVNNREILNTEKHVEKNPSAELENVVTVVKNESASIGNEIGDENPSEGNENEEQEKKKVNVFENNSDSLKLPGDEETELSAKKLDQDNGEDNSVGDTCQTGTKCLEAVERRERPVRTRVKPEQKDFIYELSRSPRKSSCDNKENPFITRDSAKRNITSFDMEDSGSRFPKRTLSSSTCLDFLEGSKRPRSYSSSSSRSTSPGTVRIPAVKPSGRKGTKSQCNESSESAGMKETDSTAASACLIPTRKSPRLYEMKPYGRQGSDDSVHCKEPRSDVFEGKQEIDCAKDPGVSIFEPHNYNSTVKVNGVEQMESL